MSRNDLLTRKDSTNFFSRKKTQASVVGYFGRMNEWEATLPWNGAQSIALRICERVIRPRRAMLCAPLRVQIHLHPAPAIQSHLLPRHQVITCLTHHLTEARNLPELFSKQRRDDAGGDRNSGANNVLRKFIGRIGPTGDRGNRASQAPRNLRALQLIPLFLNLLDFLRA
jgi:hypothetical protein